MSTLSESTRHERVGFVGLGNMGAACAHSLVRGGHDLTLWARRPETLEAFRGQPVRIAATLAELGEGVDIVFICVVDDRDVEEVMAPGALLGGLRPGSVALVLSTVAPETCTALAARALAAGVTLLDAPVTGGADRALAGTLTVMVGGPPAAFARVLPVMRAFGGQVEHLGPVGMGQMAKLINNFVFSANTLVAGEALAQAEHLGVDREAMRSVLAGGSGASFALGNVDRLLVPGSHGARLVLKDAEILARILATAGVASEALDRVRAGLAVVVSGP